MCISTLNHFVCGVYACVFVCVCSFADCDLVTVPVKVSCISCRTFSSQMTVFHCATWIKQTKKNWIISEKCQQLPNLMRRFEYAEREEENNQCISWHFVITNPFRTESKLLNPHKQWSSHKLNMGSRKIAHNLQYWTNVRCEFKHFGCECFRN